MAELMHEVVDCRTGVTPSHRTYVEQISIGSSAGASEGEIRFEWKSPDPECVSGGQFTVLTVPPGKPFGAVAAPRGDAALMEQIVGLLKREPGLDPLDIAERLEISLELANRICTELAGQGRIRSKTP